MMEGSNINSNNSNNPSSGSAPPPWTQIVRGLESDSAGDPSSPTMIPALAENIVETSDDGNAGGSKKPAWNKKPSNGSAAESGAVVMGSSWPALSESTKASPKLSSSDSSKSLSDFVPPLSSAPPGTGIALSPSSSSSSLLPSTQSQSPLQSSVTSPKPANNASHNSSVNHGRPARQKSMKRDGGGGGNAQANGGFSHQISAGQTSYNHSSSVKPGSGGGYENSGRENMQNHVTREVGSRNTGGDHHQPLRRNSFRRGNGEPHSRGDGSHQNFSGRRGDLDRGNHDWNHQRSFNGRDAPMQPRTSPRGFVRTPPPVSTPFIHTVTPVPVQPFMNPMAMPDMPVVYFSPTMPFATPLSTPMYFPHPDPQLKEKIMNQIDYYFSNENLIKDTYLRQNMDEYGWVPVSLIAGFKKVLQLTDNIPLILEAVEYSSVVEAQGDKIRRRGDYQRWIMPKFAAPPSLQSPTSPTVATLSADMQSVTLDERATNVNTEASSKSSSGDINSLSQATKDDATSSGC